MMKTLAHAAESGKSIPFVSIVFPNYNGGDFLNSCVDSLFHMIYPKERYEVIIVDNGSTDGSLDSLKQDYKRELAEKRLRIIEVGKNIGAPAAYNIGISAAYRSYDFILKMDNDLVLARDCLKEMVACAEKNPSAGVVGGKVYFYWDKKRIHAVGSKISVCFAGGKAVGGNEIDCGQFDNDMEYDAINGCMMLVKREVIEKVGTMDENYFIYFDDHDWSLRISRAGYKHIFCHSACSWHNTKPDNRYNSELWMNYAIYNSYYFAIRNYNTFFKRAVFFLAIQINVIRYMIGYVRRNGFNRLSDYASLLFRSNLQGMRLLFLGKARNS